MQAVIMTKQTDAQRFAALFGGEGENSHALGGKFTFSNGEFEVIAEDDYVLEALGRTAENGGAPQNPLRREDRRWVFADGSVIVTSEDDWYFEGPAPWSRHEGA
jgi:hypothetical protein